MDTLVTQEKKPRSGLYTLQFSYMPMATGAPTPPSNSSADAAADAAAAAGTDGGKTDALRGGANTNASKTEGAAIDVRPPSDEDAAATNAAAIAAAAKATAGGGDEEDPSGLVSDRPSLSAAEEEETSSAAAKGAGGGVIDGGLDEDSPAVREARLQALSKACATGFGSWTLLCRLRFEGDVMGRIKGSVKVKTRVPAPSAVAAAAAAASPVVVASAEAVSAAVPSADAAAGASSPVPAPAPAPAPSSSSCQPSSSSSASFSGTRACIQPDSLWKPSDEVRLLISLDRLEGSVVGLPHDLTNVAIHCHSHVSDGWYVGAATVVLSTGEALVLPRRLQFLLREYLGPRCSKCLDPIDTSDAPEPYFVHQGNSGKQQPHLSAVAAAAEEGTTTDSASAVATTTTAGSSSGILTCDGCQCVQYCSEQCRDSHAAGHALMCYALKPFGAAAGTAAAAAPSSPTTVNAGGPSPAQPQTPSSLHNGGGMYRACASFAGAEFFVYWRCVRGCTFELIADHNSPLGVPYVLLLNPLKDAREGLDYSFLTTPPPLSADDAVAADGGEAGDAPSASPPSSSPSGGGRLPAFSPEELSELNVSIFFAVAQSSRVEGALLLTAACLNHLFVFCDCVDNVVLSYYQFYDVCVRDQFEGVRNISCLSEYVMYVRTTFELGQTLLEWALKAPFASLFWQRLVAAKDVLVSLYNFNASLHFMAPIQNVKQILVPDQQRQTLHLLARIFVVMASRAPKDLAQRLLRRAEECYKDSIDEDKQRKNFKEMGVTCLKLAALATLFEASDERMKAGMFKEEGLELLKLAAKASETAARAKEVAAATAAAKAEAAALAIANNNAVAAATGTAGADPGAPV